MNATNNHPGGYLIDELVARGLTLSGAAEGIGISRRLLNDIVWATDDITTDTAAKIGEFLGTSATLWWNLQRAYDEKKPQVE